MIVIQLFIKMKLFIFFSFFVLHAYISVFNPNDLLAQEDTGDYPKEILTNGIISVLIFLPDSTNGYYRGARFDWGGIIGQVNYKSHTYFQEWKGYNETLNYGIRDVHKGTGTCEEFRIPLGYDNPDTGNKFLKIGVGILEKKEDPYFFYTKYNILDLGRWEVTKGENWMQFIHTIKTDFGYAYTYTKRIGLIVGKPMLKVTHVLENKGDKKIISNTYCHNFIRLDNVEVGEGYYAEFPVIVKPESKFHDAALFSVTKKTHLSFLQYNYFNILLHS